MRSQRLPGLLVILITTFGVLLPAQQVPGPALSDIPPEYEATIRDLVDRYEEVRQLLREQIQLNTQLYTEEEIADATEELRAEADRLEAENEEVRRQYKVLLARAKYAEDRSLRFKEELVKREGQLSLEVDTLQRIIGSIEEETLLQVGATFSPAGRIGAIGTINLPGSNVGLFTEGLYDLRDREFVTSFGVSFGLIPQRSIVEGYERLRNRFRDDDAPAADAATSTTGDGATPESASDDTPAPGGGTLFQPNRQ